MSIRHARVSPSNRAGTPLVVFIVDRSDSGACREVIEGLNNVFRCPTCCPGSTGFAASAGDVELVIWHRPAAGNFPDSAMTTALDGVSAACPIIAIADDAAAVPSHLAGRIVTDFVIRPYTCQELILRAWRLLRQPDASGMAAGHAGASPLETVIVGSSAALLNEVGKLKRFAACDAGILILGETGTGKEVFAQATHYASARAAKPMVAVNCAAVPAELMEAELFGHVKGAYTNAHTSRTGLVSEAQQGTLFLDDIDCLPLSAQAKLLRFLQEKEYRVVGSNVVQHADVRVIAASNRDLAAMARQGSFRYDLFYRLNVLTLSLPPLREHKEDIAALARHFLRQFSKRHKRPERHLLPGALFKLLGYDWPGNVRELGHVLERAVLLSQTCSLDMSDIDLPAAAQAAPVEAFQAMKARVVQSFEKSYLEGLLGGTNGNVTAAARVAGKNRRALFELIRKYEITPASFKAETHS